ncbi:MAG TPA: COX15/CtaA family protein [Gammaproteobacteria bacterium]|nr:COX15/CtaA family protein [Gammaproteobacteria bacterium]
MSRAWYLRLAILAAVLAFGVIVLGAYVRLSAAGLGCPDWPGCYGHVGVPDTHAAIAQADALHPNRPVQPARAWKEMLHRYFAGSLATLILILALAAWWRRKQTHRPVLLPSLLLLTVIFQALLGMWTVTLLLFPPVVMGHLLGGFTTFALLILLVLQTGNWLRYRAQARDFMRWLAVAGLIVLICQIALGGWTSSNYAAIACPDFPTCQAQWWPANLDFRDGFSWHGVGPDYQGGILTQSARMAIHVSHRVGALVTFLTLLGTSLAFMLKGGNRGLKWLGALVGVLLLTQVGIGIGIVELGLPLPLADAHNGVAALLLASVVTLVWSVWIGSATHGN